MASAFTAAITPGVSAQTLALTFREMAAMLRAGITVDQALEQSGGFGPLHFRSALAGLAGYVRNGEKLSDGMSMYGGLFHPVVPAVIRSGEATGSLDYSFGLLAEFFDAEAQLRRTLQGALVYPSIVFVVALLAIFILSFLGFMQSGLAVKMLWFAAFLGALWVLLRFRTIQQGARYLAMILPFFGGVIQQLAVARFCQTFGLLIRAGVPYLEGLESTLPVVQHPRVTNAANHVYYGVRNGNTVEACIRAQPVFPPIMRNLVGAGEVAGTLDESLLKAAEYLRTDAEYKIKNSAKFAGPLMTLIMAAIVLIIAMSFLKGYFQMLWGILEE